MNGGKSGCRPNPENQRTFKLHSAVFQAVAFNVVFHLIREYLWRKDFVEHFQNEYRRHLSMKNAEPRVDEDPD